MGLSLHLLGTPRVNVAGKLSDLPLDKPASLLFYLVRRFDWVSRSELAFLYRPDTPEDVALSNLRVFIYRAKARFWAEDLEVEKFRVRFQVETDVRAFLAACEQKAWSQALALYQGVFLAGIQVDVPGYQTWLELERQDLDQNWRVAALHHARDLEARQNFAGAQGWLEQVLKADPLDEEALQVYLRVLFTVGKRSQALDAFEQFRFNLEQELDIGPLEATRALLENLRQGEAEALSAPVLKPQAKHNLPAQTTRFVGRKRELAQVSDRLAQLDCRLLTLVGLGGVGKTRLALELASGQRETFADGVWFVPLAGVSSPDLLVSSLDSAIGFSLAGSRPPKEQLSNFLREKEMLLLLDNFEHLLEGAVLLEELLELAPKLKLLVTSRAALELKGEWLFDLEGLAYPPVNTTEPLDSFGAVKLFNNRAERMSATFMPQGKTLRNVADLCRKVEGLPLALELAASWTRSLSVSQLLNELDKDFSVLSSQLRDLPERHRSLRTVFDYSWRRLSGKEQAALAKLSIFQGGFTLEAAEQVADVHLALLLSLSNRSLLRRMSPSRFDMHELLKQFAFGKLQQNSERATRKQHLLFFSEFARQIEDQRHGAEQLQVKQQLQDESANCQAALEWGFNHAPSSAVRLSAYLGHYWEARGHVQEGEFWLSRALALDADTPTDISARLHLKSLSLAVVKGDYRQVERLQKATLALCVKAGNAFEAEYYNVAGWAATDQQQFDEAQSLLKRSLALTERARNDRTKNYVLLNLGVLADRQNNLVAAHEYYQTCLDLARARDDSQLKIRVICNMAGVRIALGEFETTIVMSNEALNLAHQLDDQRFLAVIKGNLGYATWHCGRREEGEKLYREHLLLLHAQGQMAHFFENAYDLANFWHQLGLIEDAICLWGAVENLQRVFGYPPPKSAHNFRSEVLGAVGEVKREALLLAGSSKSSYELLAFIRQAGS